jgi:hypothetical protein
MPHAQPIFDLIDVVTVDTECKSRSSSLCSFLHTPVTSSYFDPDIILSTPFCNTRRPCFVTQTKKLNIPRRLKERWTESSRQKCLQDWLRRDSNQTH